MKFILVPAAFEVVNGTIRNDKCTAKIYQPNPTQHVNVAGMSYPVISSGIQSQDLFVYDPMDAYREWYLPDDHKYKNFMFIGQNDIIMKTWDQFEISDWINNNCQSFALVQKTHNMWSFTFALFSDFTLFSMWWKDLVKQHSMKIDLTALELTTFQAEAQISEWCKENLRGAWKLQREYDTLQSWVKDEHDAVLFRLRWSDSSYAKRLDF